VSGCLAWSWGPCSLCLRLLTALLGRIQSFLLLFFSKSELCRGISILDIALAETAAAEAVLKYSKKVDKADRHHGAVTKKRKTKKPDRLAPSVKKSRWGLSGSK
jgi:hypothetical protein